MDRDSGAETVFRRMTAADLPGAEVLRQLAGWNQSLEDWRRLLSLQPGGCFVATEDGAVIGTVTTISYGRALGWIGMMLVHPSDRHRGIGSRLMRRALGFLHDAAIPCVKLDATPLGLPLYEKLGFASEGGLTRYLRPAAATVLPLPAARAETRRLDDSDWPALEQIDSAAFGASRLSLLRLLEPQSRAALVCTKNGALSGYGMLRPGSHADYLGPLVCPDPADALTLARALLDLTRGRDVIWDVLDGYPAVTAAARQLGFVPQRPLTRMRLGPPMTAGNLASQPAIADPAVG